MRNVLFCPCTEANAYYIYKEEELNVRLGKLECELRSADPLREKMAQQTLVKEVCPELGFLREYVVLNYTAVVKIVKKGNKNLGQTTHAVQLLADEPIFCSSGLAKLVTRAEMLTVHAAPAAERKMADHCCPICDEVLSNPIILPCKHRFCFKCITSATLDDSCITETSEATRSERGTNDSIPSSFQKTGSHSPFLHLEMPSVQRTSKTLVRGACPVCRKPHVHDESGLRVDPQLDEFIRLHFHDEGRTSTTMSDENHQSGSDPLNLELRMCSTHRLPDVSSALPTIPKALIIVVAGCRSDTLLAANTPTMSAYVRGDGCFSFNMRHTWSHCSRTPSDSIMPLLTGSKGGALEAVRTKRDGKTEKDEKVKNMFSRLAQVRSWMNIKAAVGGAPELASTLAADTTELLVPSGANDEEAAAAAAHSLASGTNPDLLFLHLSGVQDAGALYGYGPHIAKYRESIELADVRIARVLQSLRVRQATSPHEDWLVIIASPAGGTSRADMPAAMQGHFDAADWCDGGGRQLRAAGVTGLEYLPQHATGWVLMDAPAATGFSGGRIKSGRACGELLPPPCDVDIAPTVLEHFGVAPRRQWELDGAHLLAARRTNTALSHSSEMSTGTSFSGSQNTAVVTYNVAIPKAASTCSADDTYQNSINPPSSTTVRENEKILQPSRLSPSFTCQISDEIPFSSSYASDAAMNAACFNHIGGSADTHKEDRASFVSGHSPSAAPGPFASHLPGLFEPTGCAVVGHRGFGMNRCPGRGIRENTVASFIAAHSSGAGWCEFDVQVTADGIPVLWHDDILLVRHGFGPIQSFSIRELELAELKALSRAAVATAAAAAAGVPAAIAATAGGESPGDTGEPKKMCVADDNEEDDDDDDDDDDSADDIPVVFYRKFPVGYGARLAPEPEPWIMDVEDEIPTLEELMTHTPPELGLSMELKFDEANPCDTPRLVAELRAILAVCQAHPCRRILFSSFDPDAALLMRALQGLYPVMLISDCEPHHSDPRRCSVAAAKKCALEGGLCGLVLDVRVLAEGSKVADDIRSSGLLLGTYGKENDAKPLASKQVEWGMCLVCTDNVAGLADMFNAPKVNQGNTEPARAPLMSPSLDAAAAARKLGEMELEAVIRAPWYQLSDDGKKNIGGESCFPMPPRKNLRRYGDTLERVGTA